MMGDQAARCLSPPLSYDLNLARTKSSIVQVEPVPSVFFGSAEIYTTACPVNMNSHSLLDWCQRHQLQTAVINDSKR